MLWRSDGTDGTDGQLDDAPTTSPIFTSLHFTTRQCGVNFWSSTHEQLSSVERWGWWPLDTGACSDTQCNVHNSCSATNYMSLYCTKLYDGHADVSWHTVQCTWMSIMDSTARVGTLHSTYTDSVTTKCTRKTPDEHCGHWGSRWHRVKPVSVWCRSKEYFTSHTT